MTLKELQEYTAALQKEHNEAMASNKKLAAENEKLKAENATLSELAETAKAENEELKPMLEASQAELEKAKAEKKASAKSGYPTAEVDGKLYAIKAKQIRVAGAKEPLLALVDEDGEPVHANVRKAVELESGFVVEIPKT